MAFKDKSELGRLFRWNDPSGNFFRHFGLSRLRGSVPDHGLEAHSGRRRSKTSTAALTVPNTPIFRACFADLAGSRLRETLQFLNPARSISASRRRLLRTKS